MSTSNSVARRRLPRAIELAGALLVAGALLLSSVPPARAGEAPLEFNYGIPTADHATVYVAQDLNLFEKVGLRPTFFYFQSGAPLLAGLKSDSLDVVTAGLALTFALGQNIPLKFIFWEANNAAGEGLIVDPKSEVKSFRDIANAKKIGAASGTCAQVALYLMAKQVGVDYAKLNVVNIPAPLFRNSFLSNSIDAGVAWPPYSFQLKSEGFPIASFDEEYTPPGGACPGLTAVRPAFLKQHPEIGLRLVQAEALAREAIARNPQVAIDAYAKRLQISPEVAKAALDRQCCGRVPSFTDQVDPNTPYSMTSKEGGLAGKLKLASDVLYATKAIAEPIPLKVIQDAIDPTYLREYLKTSK